MLDRSYSAYILLWIYSSSLLVQGLLERRIVWSPRMMLSANSTAEEQSMYNCSVEQWRECQSCQPCETRKKRCEMLRQAAARCINARRTVRQVELTLPSTDHWSCIEEDQILEDNQILSLSEQLNNTCPTGSRRRVKRKIRRFSDFPVTKWDTKIYYKVDGSLREHESRLIKSAIDMWTQGTCLEFVQVGVNRRLTNPHILFSKVPGWGCYSFIGRSSIVPQPIYLSYTCFSSAGYIAHEIGHSLGLFHEHQRIDRDEYISIRSENISPGAEGNFAMVLAKFIEDKNVPYDLGSVMHYRAMAFSVNGRPTVETADSRYQRTIGQRVELSFADMKIINLAYCTSRCRTRPLPRSCANRGYQDPKDCSRCRCPDGLGGRFCEDVVVNNVCGGALTAQPEGQGPPGLVSSPEYNRGYYDIGTECSWKITAQQGYRVKLWFTGQFGLYCFSNRCRHWVEVRHNGDLGRTGPRLCCRSTPTETFLSDGADMLVVFKSTARTSLRNNRRGFKFHYSAVKQACPTNPCHNGAFCWQSSPVTQVCECRSGYYGPYCDSRQVQPITSRPDPPTPSPRPTPHPPRPAPCTASPPSPPRDRSSNEDSMDLVVLLDSSVSSRERKPWSSYTWFVQALIERAQLASDRDRVGIISYNKYANVTVQLGATRSSENIRDALQGVLLQAFEANPYKALWLLQHDMLRDSRRNRADVPDVAVIVTDSNFPQNFPQGIIVQGAMQAREAGIHIVAIGVGPRVNRATMEVLTGASDNVFMLRQEQLFNHSAVLLIMDRIKQLARGGINRQNSGSGRNQEIATTWPSTTLRTTTITTTRPTTTTTRRTTTTTTPTTTTTTTTRATTRTTTTPPTTTTTTPRPTTTTTRRTTPRTTTTTTTPRPTTTTTRRTPAPAAGRGQPASRNSGRRYQRQTCMWEKVSNCSKPCGGCGRERWRYVCTRSDGYQQELAVREAPCNEKKCQEWCLRYIARVYYMPCGPECCGDYKPQGNKCVNDNIV